MTQNKYGLRRNIPLGIKRKVRQDCKFGCVICRSGIYTFEHIDPVFTEAKRHEVENICCLCATCHQSVTARQISKAAVKAKYAEIKIQSAESVNTPTGPLDFHTGAAELSIGRLLYAPGIRSVIRYHGKDFIKVIPGPPGKPGEINAIFADDRGVEILALRKNEWEGSVDNWDIEVAGQRITVRQAQRKISLCLRLDPPGRIVIERLDMRIADAHVLASEFTYAVGRYLDDGSMFWAHADISVVGASSEGVAIEFASTSELQKRVECNRGGGQSLANSHMVMQGGLGVVIPGVGVSIGSYCSMHLRRISAGTRGIENMRQVVFNAPDAVFRYIADGISPFKVGAAKF